MRSAVLSLAVIAVLIPRSASPADRTNAAPIRQPAQQQPIAPTLQVYSRETIVDVVVTDPKGNPVHGLKQSDFTLLEDGKQMIAKSFAEHRTDIQPSQPAVAPAKIDLGPNTFTNYSPGPPASGPLNILLLDSSNVPTPMQQILRQQMLDFVKRAAPGTRIAVFTLTDHLSILQGFTADSELIKAAILSKQNISQSSPIEDPGYDPADNPGCGVCPANLSISVERMALRAQYAIAAMKQIARYVSGMPERKNLVWFGGSFSMTWPPIPSEPGLGTPGSDYDFTNEMNAAIDLLARSHVSIYPIDPRALDAISNGRGQQRARVEQHYTMDVMADRTGGKAFYHNNDLTSLTAQAIDAGSNYYTLTYTPTNPKLDTRFRKITVKVTDPKLHLTYREGYYAVDPTTDARGKKIVANATPMQTALLRGAPEPTEIIFKTRILTAPGTDNSLPVANQVDAKQMKPPYRHFTVWYAAGIRNVEFTPSSDNIRHGNLELVISAYNSDGQIVNTAATVLHLNLTAAQYAGMLQSGVVTKQEIAIPAKGDYILRIAVHDLTSDRVGAIEVPTDSVHPDPVPAVASGSPVL